MRELHGRHSRDTGVDLPHGHARDARQPRYEIVHDAATRVARALAHRQNVEAEYAAYDARHAKPDTAEAGRTPADSADRPASRIAARDIPRDQEAAGNRKRERSWLPSNEASQVAVSVDALFIAVNSAYHIAPGRMDGIAAAALGVVVAGVAWANKRWKGQA